MLFKFPIKPCLRIGLLLVAAFSLNACAETAKASEITLTPAATEEPTPAVTPSPTSIFPVEIGLSANVPEGLVESLNIPPDLNISGELEKTPLLLTSSDINPVSVWVYALAAPFPTLADKVDSASLVAFWRGENSTSFPASKILVTENTYRVLESIWGKAGNTTIEVSSQSGMLEKAWKGKDLWAIIPFESIEPRWKIIAIDHQSPIRKDFDLNQYPLKATISLDGNPEVISAILEKYGPASQTPLAPGSNRDPKKLTTLALTGVTALVRGTASMMELKGLTYPGQDIREILRSADITHISNEIPFSLKCPPPYPRENDLVFCSRPPYIKLLEDVGVDVVELTGDHFQDWGPEAMLYTLDLYHEKGWKYYGGGANLEEARQPALFVHNNNKIAFIGCNAKEPGYAGAGLDEPGAVHCDPKWISQEIHRLVNEGYIPIVTFQHLEYYTYKAHPILEKDFRNMANAGAVIVSGSQAHQPHAIEFYKGAFLHYGLGNLFFDQVYEGDPTRQAFIDIHVIYDGKYINTELISIWFIDLARPRLMTTEERQDLLSIIFKASGW